MNKKLSSQQVPRRDKRLLVASVICFALAWWGGCHLDSSGTDPNPSSFEVWEKVLPRARQAEQAAPTLNNACRRLRTCRLRKKLRNNANRDSGRCGPGFLSRKDHATE